MGTKIPATAAFLIAILLFLLPFAEIRCNGSAIASNTGVGIAMGSQWKEKITDNIFGNSLGNTFGNNNETENKKEFQKQDANVFAIAAIALGVLGLLIAFLLPKGGGKLNMFIGILAAVSLIAMLIDLKSKVKSDTSLKSSDIGFNAGVNVSLDGTPAFWFTLLLFLLAALFSWQRSKFKSG
ncbi:MAG TPA: hypothetical protein VK588_07840 [Chitinophagaceae bacterium]|nr:hypothetical protein [Chitinophagaceae bacterium]